VPRGLLRNNAVFSRGSFVTDGKRLDELSLLGLTLCACSWESLTSRHHSDALCRPVALRRSFHPPTSLAVETPRDLVSEDCSTTGPKPPCRIPVKKHDNTDLGRLWLARPHLGGEGDYRCLACSLSARCSQSTNFASLLKTCLVRVIGFAGELPRATFRARSPKSFSEMIPLTNLCNRLVVTSTRQIPNSQVWDLRPSNHRYRLRVPPEALASAFPWSCWRWRGLAVAGFFRPGWRHDWCRVNQLWPTSPSQ